MDYFLKGMGYGCLAFGWLLTFGGGLVIFVSMAFCFGDFLDWMKDRREKRAKGNESD